MANDGESSRPSVPEIIKWDERLRRFNDRRAVQSQARRNRCCGGQHRLILSGAWSFFARARTSSSAGAGIVEALFLVRRPRKNARSGRSFSEIAADSVSDSHEPKPQRLREQVRRRKRSFIFEIGDSPGISCNTMKHFKIEFVKKLVVLKL